jgi:thiol-disulfide isomerase/thioredoxin
MITVGDRAPDVELKLYNAAKPKAKLSDYRGQMLILDFWATWCSSCIKAFPKNDSLLWKFKGKVRFLLVNAKGNGDDKEKIETFYKRYNKNGKTLTFPTVYEDETLSKLFPHKLIPHYVWIGGDGIVQAITSSEYVTAKNIEGILNGTVAPLPLKMDIDRTKPLYSGEFLPENALVQYSILIKGKQDGLPGNGGGSVRMAGNIIYGRAITNATLLELYMDVLMRLDPFIAIDNKRILLNVTDSSRLIKEKSTLPEAQWNRYNLYTYDLIVPIKDAPKLYQYMLEDLNRYSDYEGRIVKQKMNCLILRSIAGEAKLSTKGGKIDNRPWDPDSLHLSNASVQDLVVWINNAEGLQQVVLDETMYTGKIDISIHAKRADLPAVQKELAKYNLELVEGARELDVFVLTGKE